MNYRFRILTGLFAMLFTSSFSFAGSERLIMSMTPEKMNQMDLVYVGFTGPDGIALESNLLKKMSIRAQDCNSGNLMEIVNDYKIGYSPETMLVGIYLFPQAWRNRMLCFSIPDMGKIKLSSDPTAQHSRIFQLQFAPE